MPATYETAGFRAGLAPGTLLINARSPKPELKVMDYNAEHCMEQVLERPSDVIQYLQDGVVSNTWIDIHGLGDEANLRELGIIFDIHPLALEDVVHVGQRPKVETYERNRFVIARMAEYTRARGLQTEQLSLLLGPNFLLSFQEMPGDTFDPIRERLRKGGGLLRKLGPDYLMYALLDATIDHYFPVMEKFGERLEELEDEVVRDPRPATLRKIHQIKAELLVLRRAIWPQRDTVNALLRDDSDLLLAETRVGLRDCYDHTVQLMDMVETYRELSSGLLDIYMSSIANRTNEVMKVLTIVSTIFIPLTFIAGVYGMNFEPTSSPYNMPELKWRFGYPAVMMLMGGIALCMLWLFWRMGWLSRNDVTRQDLPAMIRTDLEP
jgi:magnesium transporter